MPNVAKSQPDPSKIVFSPFRCECEECDAEGDLELLTAEGHKPFDCPEGCGAVYVPWRNPMNFNRWELKAVVMPMFR